MTITLPFTLTNPSDVFVGNLFSQAGVADISDIHVAGSGLTEDGFTLTISVSRQLTADEKAAVKTAFLASLIRIEDGE